MTKLQPPGTVLKPLVEVKAFKTSYALGFALAHLIVFVAKFTSLLPEWMAPVGFAFFTLVEIMGASKDGAPDTWSELIWLILAGKPIRTPFVLGWLGWAMLTVVFFLRDMAYVWEVPLPEFVLLAGTTLWLLPHFFLVLFGIRGRLG